MSGGGLGGCWVDWWEFWRRSEVFIVAVFWFCAIISEIVNDPPTPFIFWTVQFNVDLSLPQ